MDIKKGSKNALENRGDKHVDERGEQVVIIKNGKRQVVFEKDGVYRSKEGEIVEL